MLDRFPDGQLYLNLRGFSPDEQVMSTAEALRCLLTGLGVPARDMPSTMDAQVGRYRTEMAGRQILVVLDNARDVDQVRELLPGTGMVLITSRHQMTGLVAWAGATSLSLAPLAPPEAICTTPSRPTR